MAGNMLWNSNSQRCYTKICENIWLNYLSLFVTLVYLQLTVSHSFIIIITTTTTVIGIIVIFLSQVSFPLVLLPLNQWCTPPLRFQVSDCSTLLIMCNVPSTAVLFVYRGESIDCPPGSVYSFYLVKDYNSSGPIITGMTKRFICHIRWISRLRFLYLNFFPVFFFIIFIYSGITTSIDTQILSDLFLIIMSGLLARISLSGCTPSLHSVHIPP